jgi:mono/diheme cytochrome c family protein
MTGGGRRLSYRPDGDRAAEKQHNPGSWDHVLGALVYRRKIRPRGVASIAAALLFLLLSAGEQAPAADGAAPPRTAVEQFHADILPMLEKHCYECHGDGYDKGKVAFDSLDTDEKILNPELWLRVLNNTRAGLMPAERNPPLSPAEQGRLEQWIKQSVFRLDARNPDPGRVTLRRLNRVEYRNTVRDLLGVDFNTEEEFPPDDTGFGFDNIGDALTMSPMLMEKYVAAAQAIVAKAVPLAPTEPAQARLPGSSFTAGDAAANAGQAKNDARRLVYYDAASVANAITVPHGGRYRVVLELDVDGSFEFDPARTRAVFEVDGAAALSRDFGWFHERAFTFETTHQWTAGEHRFSFEVTPLNSVERKKDALTLVLRNVTVIGPLEKDKWVPTRNYDRFFPRAIPDGRAARREYARETLAQFATRAYRRPLEPGTADRLAAFAESIYRQRGKSFEQGIAHAMAGVLASPHFLFRHEGPAAATPIATAASTPARPHAEGPPAYAYIDEYSLASRLSYFLWSTMPDEELIALAGRGELRQNLAAQVERMLADPRAESLAQNFTGQWLQVRDVPGIAINAREILVRDAGAEKTLHELRAAWRRSDEATAKMLAKQVDTIVETQGNGITELDGKLRASMRRETEMYFAHVVREDRPVTDFLDSNYTFLNDELAKLYGIPGVSGPEMRLVTLPAGSPRGGVLTQGASLVVTSNPDRTSPVKRGLFVLANFLGTPPPPPPPNIPALEASETSRDGQESTLRDSLLKHRENPSCASCHNRMDPIGLAFENFNALGMWRDTERLQPILAPGELITGEKFDGVAQLKRILATEHREDFYRTLTDKLLTYAMGRGTEYYDVDTIDGIVNRLTANGGRFSAMLMGIIESAPFQKMRLQATATVGSPMQARESVSETSNSPPARSKEASQ